MPMALLLNGKAYSIVTDQLGTPTEAYNAEGEEVWRRRLDMNGKILEEVYTETPLQRSYPHPFPFPRAVLRPRDGAGIQQIPILRPRARTIHLTRPN